MEQIDEAQEPVKDYRGYVRCSAWIILFGLLIWFAIFVFNLPNQPGSGQVARRAKGTLRSIGSSQIAYSETNDVSSYGSFEALQEEFYIPEGYTLGNMIDFYSMTWEIHSTSSTYMDDLLVPVMNQFTIVAYPRNTEWRSLQTYGITEDQIVRFYNPKHKNDPNNVKTWDPIL